MVIIFLMRKKKEEEKYLLHFLIFLINLACWREVVLLSFKAWIGKE